MTIYVTSPQVTAGYLDTSRGETYCHSVWRMFQAKGLLSEGNEIAIEDFLKICPLEKEKIESIFADGKYIVNRFEDIYNGKETGKETWEWGHPYMNGWESIDAKALDDEWYKSQTFKEKDKELNAIFKTANT